MKQLNAVPALTKFLQKLGKSKKLASARAAHQKHYYPTLENQAESLLNEAISLISIDNSSCQAGKKWGVK